MYYERRQDVCWKYLFNQLGVYNSHLPNNWANPSPYSATQIEISCGLLCGEHYQVVSNDLFTQYISFFTPLQSHNLFFFSITALKLNFDCWVFFFHHHLLSFLIRAGKWMTFNIDCDYSSNKSWLLTSIEKNNWFCTIGFLCKFHFNSQF